jgi:hypothetical protein
MSDAHFSKTSLRQTNQRRIRSGPISLTDRAHEDMALLFASSDVVDVRAAMKCLIGRQRALVPRPSIRSAGVTCLRCQCAPGGGAVLFAAMGAISDGATRDALNVARPLHTHLAS